MYKTKLMQQFGLTRKSAQKMYATGACIAWYNFTKNVYSLDWDVIMFYSAIHKVFPHISTYKTVHFYESHCKNMWFSEALIG